MEHTILHVDGDSFFASCEASLDPKLKDRPVVTGQERGIATALSKEAKALGISRGMPIFKIRKLFPEVTVVNSNYKSYEIFAQRVYDIVRRYSPKVEEYSIDECFCDLTGLVGPSRASETHSGIGFVGSKVAKIELGESLKDSLYKELGMTFSVGIGPTKCLAKIASKHNKPDGLTVIEHRDIESFLRDYPIAKVWGIGPQTTREMEGLGIKTALDFIEKREDWVEAKLSRPYIEIWHELQGTLIHEVDDSPDYDDYKSIQRTRTFTPPTKDRKILLTELSKNIEHACTKIRRHNFKPKRIHYFLKTQEFRYHRKEIIFINPLSNPNDIIREVNKTFNEVYKPNTLYRATGVTLSELISNDHVQPDLFGASKDIDKWSKVFQTLDNIDHRYGSQTIVLGSSLLNPSFEKKLKNRGSGQFSKKSDKNLFENKLNKKTFRIPYMGEVI